MLGWILGGLRALSGAVLIINGGRKFIRKYTPIPHAKVPKDFRYKEVIIKNRVGHLTSKIITRRQAVIECKRERLDSMPIFMDDSQADKVSVEAITEGFSIHKTDDGLAREGSNFLLRFPSPLDKGDDLRFETEESTFAPLGMSLHHFVVFGNPRGIEKLTVEAVFEGTTIPKVFHCVYNALEQCVHEKEVHFDHVTRHAIWSGTKISPDLWYGLRWEWPKEAEISEKEVR